MIEITPPYGPQQTYTQSTESQETLTLEDIQKALSDIKPNKKRPAILLIPVGTGDDYEVRNISAELFEPTFQWSHEVELPKEPEYQKRPYTRSMFSGLQSDEDYNWTKDHTKTQQ